MPDSVYVRGVNHDDIGRKRKQKEKLCVSDDPICGGPAAHSAIYVGRKIWVFFLFLKRKETCCIIILYLGCCQWYFLFSFCSSDFSCFRLNKSLPFDSFQRGWSSTHECTQRNWWLSHTHTHQPVEWWLKLIIIINRRFFSKLASTVFECCCHYTVTHKESPTGDWVLDIKWHN